MKLLLTSNGVANNEIVNALRNLVDTDFANASLAFIPTAAIPTSDDKGWLVNDLARFHALGFKSMDIVELAGLESGEAKQRLESAQVIVFGGGHTHYLRSQIERCADDQYWTNLFQDRIYVGISAGSMMSTPHLVLNSGTSIWPGELKGESDPWRSGFGFVDFYLRPHFNSPAFPCSQPDVLESVAHLIPTRFYAVDDNSALSVVNGEVEFVGNGEVRPFNR